MDLSAGSAMCDEEPTAKKQKLEHVEMKSGCDSMLEESPVHTPREHEQHRPTCTGGSAIAKPVTEKDVGITEYISSHAGFHGIIKQRFSDFLVYEVDLSGRVTHLTDLSEPKSEEVKELGTPSENILSEPQMNDLTNLMNASLEAKREVIIPAGDKQHRTQIHEAIRKHFPQLESATADREGSKVIIISKATGQDTRRGKAQPMRRKEPWPHHGTDYCYFCLYKENMDTMEAVNILSKYLYIKPSMVAYAGTKDKRAKTCQKMCVYRISAAKLHSLNQRLRCMALGNFSYQKKSISLGDLKGNHFIIILRGVTGSTEQIDQVMDSLKTVGFLNYFGMQRFGTSSVPTHLVGRALLKSDWQEAIELIMKPREGAREEISKARISWWNDRDARKALELLGNQHCPERYLLTGLKQRNSKDLVGALGCIPRNQRTMYVHAYQSCIWNKMLSRRCKEHGLEPIVGDLVFESDVENATEGEDREKKEFIHPAIITEENISSYTIYNVVLPLPGYDVMFPQNALGQGYRDLLEDDELSVQELKHKVKDYALRGHYRHILIKPDNLCWENLRYNNGNDSLVLSDFEQLKGMSLPEYNPDGQHQALKLEFSLPSSTYATMAIREVLKQDTSSANQARLTLASAGTTGPKDMHSAQDDEEEPCEKSEASENMGTSENKPVLDAGS